jgi:Dockerin type I domain
MDFDPTTGILWASVANNFGMAASYLTTIDPATGIVTVIGQTASGLDALAVEPELLFTSAASRMVHGSAGPFDIDLPITGEPGVECRDGNGNYTIIFTFTNPIVSGSASLTSGQGNIAGSPSFVGNSVAVQLTGVTDAQTLSVTLSKIVDNYGQTLPDAQVSVNMLIGDTTGNKAVNTSDIAQTKGQSGMPANSATFRSDINASGSITASDIAQVKASSGHAIP